MPGTSVRPGGSARPASGMPASVSWSVSAITSRPASRGPAHHLGGRIRAIRGGAVGVQIDAHERSS